MGAKFWLATVAAGIGGFLAFRRFQDLGQEHREATGGRVQSTISRAPAAGGGVEDRLLNLIRARPGLLQPDIYGELEDLDRKFLQDLLLRLARTGRVRRVRERSSYRVFPV